MAASDSRAGGGGKGSDSDGAGGGTGVCVCVGLDLMRLVYGISVVCVCERARACVGGVGAGGAQLYRVLDFKIHTAIQSCSTLGDARRRLAT